MLGRSALPDISFHLWRHVLVFLIGYRCIIRQFALAALGQAADEGVYLGDQVVDAINAGGPPHTDVFGIRYRADPLEGRAGTSSDFGRRYLLGRVPPPDQILYQTERFHTADFQYDVRIPDDGDYVLVMKFSEVYFGAPNEKMFDVVLNDEHTVVSRLDIFAKVGKAIAHDEIVPFVITAGKLAVDGDEISFTDRKLKIQLRKGDYDNPKLNAFYIIKGVLEDIPPMPPLEEEVEPTPETESEDGDESIAQAETDTRFASGPKQADPYSYQDQSQMYIPILVALACFFPVLFCLCKL